MSAHQTLPARPAPLAAPLRDALNALILALYPG